jgi:hypothetical protein
MMDFDRFEKHQKVLLFLVPILYLVAGIYFRLLLGNLSLRSVDPDYVYFISGLSISEGFFKVGHIDHPGTPLQILIAVLFRIIFLFRGSNVSYIEDVFLHPDLYLSISNVLVTVITAALLIYAGRKVLEPTKSVFYAVLVQTAPFLPVIWYDLIGRITPELMMPFPIILLTVLIIKIYYTENSVSYKTVILLALVSAFGLSIKLTYILLWMIPFLIIDTWRKRFVFVGLSFFMFFILAIPVTLQLNVFWGWVKNLFMHSGQYGGGESNIIDFASLGTNLKELYGYEKRYFYIYFGLIAVFSGYLIYFRKKAEKRIVLLAIAVIVTIAAQLLITGKHYAHRYFIPVLMLSPLMVFIIAEMIKKFYPKKITTYIINIGIVGFLFWNVQFNREWLPVKSEAMGTDIENRMQTWHVVQSLEKDSYKIIASQNYGCPFIEYALMYSTVYANHAKREEYATILGLLYPTTYNYFTFDNTFRFWGEKFNARKIIDSGKKTYLYLERNEEELFNRTINKLIEESVDTFEVERELIYLNEKTAEIIYQLTFSHDVY